MKLNIFILAIGLCLLACSKEYEDNNENNPKEEEQEKNSPRNNAEYYVKYHYYANGYQHYCFFDIIYINKQTSNSDGAVNKISYQYPYSQAKVIDKELICGPFEYGDKVSLEMTNESSVVSKLLEIYISKNNSPFALRKSSKGSLVEYTIDY